MQPVLRAIAYVLLLFSSRVAGADSYPEKMEFIAFSPCRGNASFCATRILAQGRIDDEAPERLERLLKGWPNRSVTIVFDSPGGSLLAGVRMGELIRAHRVDTLVAAEYSEEVLEPGGFSTTLRVISPRPVCYSSCAYAFMGGVSRTVEDGARIGIHQFKSVEGDIGEERAQQVVSVMSRYVERMGVDRAILDVAGLVGPNDLHVLSVDDAVRTGLDNQRPPRARWSLSALRDGEIYAELAQRLPGSDRSTTFMVSRRDAERAYLVVVLHGPMDGEPDGDVTFAYSQASRAEFCSGEGPCFSAEPVGAWKLDPRVRHLTMAYLVDEKAMSALAAGDSIEFEAGLPLAYSHIAPDVEIDTGELAKLLLALSRSY